MLLNCFVRINTKAVLENGNLVFQAP